MSLQPPAHLHLVGVGGAGMSSLARFALEAGYTLSGSDSRESPRLAALREAGARVHVGHDPAHARGAAAVVVSSAVPADNVEVHAARAQGVPVLRRGELLAALVAAHPSGVAVCGTHGKGTTGGALVAMLEASGARVSYILGAPLKDTQSAARHAPNTHHLIAEVDESDRTHLAQRPHHLLINNLEVDHLHTYADLDALVEDFTTLLCEHHAGAGACVVGLDGDGIAPLLARAKAAGRAVVTCGLDHDAAQVQGRDLALAADGSLAFDLWRDDTRLGRVISPLRGALNARNLVAASAMALELGVDFAAIAAGAARYHGLVDRFDEQEAGGRRVITDYTSHPTSIRGGLELLQRQNLPRVLAVFQPFRYSLLSHYWQAYVGALALADEVHIAPMDGGGEARVDGVGCHELTEALRARGVRAQRHGALDNLEAHLSQTLSKGEALIVFGGGPLFNMAHRLASRWRG